MVNTVYGSIIVKKTTTRHPCTRRAFGVEDVCTRITMATTYVTPSDVTAGRGAYIGGWNEAAKHDCMVVTSASRPAGRSMNLEEPNADDTSQQVGSL